VLAVDAVRSESYAKEFAESFFYIFLADFWLCGILAKG